MMFLTSFFPSCPPPWAFPSLSCQHLSLDDSNGFLTDFSVSCLNRLIHSLLCCKACLSNRPNHVTCLLGLFSSSSLTISRFLTPCLASEDLVQPKSQFYPFLKLSSQPSACPSLKCTVPSKKVNNFSSLCSLLRYLTFLRTRVWSLRRSAFCNSALSYRTI